MTLAGGQATAVLEAGIGPAATGGAGAPVGLPRYVEMENLAAVQPVLRSLGKCTVGSGSVGWLTGRSGGVGCPQSRSRAGGGMG
jgi:hypothetical protein